MLQKTFDRFEDELITYGINKHGKGIDGAEAFRNELAGMILLVYIGICIAAVVFTK